MTTFPPMRHFIILLLLVLMGPVSRAESSPQATDPAKKYSGDVSLADAPRRHSDQLPLSDQTNQGGWTLDPVRSDEFAWRDLDTTRWFPNNPKWKGRSPTCFHPSNVSLAGGELVFRINQHGDAKLPETFTHTAGFM